MPTAHAQQVLEKLRMTQVQACPSQGDLQTRLQDTYSAFHQVSAQLNRSYEELEQRVDDLQLELEQADQARERELNAREALAERLHQIVNTMPVAVVLLDGRGQIVQANQMAESLFGCTLVGELWLNIIRDCFSPDQTDGHEIPLRNGKLVSVATQSLNQGSGQIIVLNDHTETRRLQYKLNHHRKLSEMGKMTASLAHQIRTPLSTAMLYADHLESMDLTEDRRLRYAGKLKSRLRQLEQQVRDMLIFSKGGVALDARLSVLDLITRFHGQVEDVQQATGAWIDFAGRLPSGEVRCNLELLSSVFTNLLENAVEACRGAGITPLVRITTALTESGLLKFQISDNGPGLKKGVELRVTEPFFTTKSTGTGLGLAVVKAVVEEHGGEFYIVNGEQGGAVANLVLPLLPEREESAEEALS